MIRYDIALSFVPLGKIVLIKMLERFGSAEKIFSLSHCELTANNGLSDRDADKFLQCKSRCYEKACREFKLSTDLCSKVIPFTGDEYPTLLKECEDAPVVIYVMGNDDLNVRDQKWLSVVGARRCSEDSVKIIGRMIDDMAERQSDMVVVSGLSYGVERFTCERALKKGIRVVAVLVTPFEGIDENCRNLASEILSKNGTLITEYPPAYSFLNKNYEEHNRIKAGLSHATVVIQAGADSNTLKTAHFASSYNRSVFAFPGGALNADFAGSNKLIKTGEAEFTTEFRDIELSLGMKIRLEPIDIFQPKLSPIGEKIYGCLKDGGRFSDEEIMAETGLTIAEFNSEIIYLTVIHNLVEEFGGRKYMKK